MDVAKGVLADGKYDACRSLLASLEEDEPRFRIICAGMFSHVDLVLPGRPSRSFFNWTACYT